EDGPLAVPVLKEDVTFHLPNGAYQFVANMHQGAAPLGRAVEFYISDAATFPSGRQTVVTLGFDSRVDAWLKGHGNECQPFGGAPPEHRELILVGDASRVGPTAPQWRELARRMARGSTVVFLAPGVFQRATESTAWLPLERKGRCYRFHDMLYHKECVAKTH